MTALKLALALAVAFSAACMPPAAVEPAGAPTLSTMPPPPVPASLDWVEAVGFPPGAQMALVSGDPTREGPFTLRLRLPNDYVVPPHSHPGEEEVTVISGVLHVGMGGVFTMSGDITELRAGQSIVLAGDAPHFAHAAGDTEIEVRGVGPFAVNYVNPADDPRR